ncbi:MAG: aminotransferase class V-fold PLP-dependent enzyme [Erysipelotrichaceae bacterium]|nr:aminotransferase class V-fold PLP-dependent enzyme [Erysipelotrichaceae bacterium]
MYSFTNDYSSPCCEEILEAIASVRNNQYSGYSLDSICDKTRDKIRNEIGKPDADVHFLVGGTQANLIVLMSMLRPHEAVIACESGHINTHEAGSVEGTGHKVETVKGIDGKVTAAEVEQLVLARPNEHMVKPAAVYVSDSTEIGTIYTLKELEELRAVCDKYDLGLFLDGARLFSALTSPLNDISIKDLARLCDVFYIGGTKNGALFGEAVVILSDKYKDGFRYIMKQRGALLAKGYLLGIQFDCLFTDDLGYRLADHANKMAFKLQAGLEKAGCRFLSPCYSNQIFPILDNDLIKKLQEDYSFEMWEPGKEESVIRLVCAYNTPEEKIDEFIDNFKKLV